MVKVHLQDEDRIETAKSFFYAKKQEMLQGTEILWDEYLDYYYLMCKKIINRKQARSSMEKKRDNWGIR